LTVRSAGRILNRRHPGVELHEINLLRLPADQEALVLGGNALRLVGGTSARARALSCCR
jgi:hypothetical protein